MGYDLFGLLIQFVHVRQISSFKFLPECFHDECSFTEFGYLGIYFVSVDLACSAHTFHDQAQGSVEHRLLNFHEDGFAGLCLAKSPVAAGCLLHRPHAVINLEEDYILEFDGIHALYGFLLEDANVIFRCIAVKPVGNLLSVDAFGHPDCGDTFVAQNGDQTFYNVSGFSVGYIYDCFPSLILFLLAELD